MCFSVTFTSICDESELMHLARFCVSSVLWPFDRNTLHSVLSFIYYVAYGPM